MTPADSPRRPNDWQVSDEGHTHRSTPDRHPHPDAAALAFVDGYIAALLDAAHVVDIDAIDLAIGKLRLGVALLEVVAADRRTP